MKVKGRRSITIWDLEVNQNALDQLLKKEHNRLILQSLYKNSKFSNPNQPTLLMSVTPPTDSEDCSPAPLMQMSPPNFKKYFITSCPFKKPHAD